MKDAKNKKLGALRSNTMPDLPTSIAYLELSDPTSGTHKFYEATVEGNTLTIRFGRIGTNGQIQVAHYSSTEESQHAAQRKIKEKLAKGYRIAAIGESEKKPTHRREKPSLEEQLATLAACGISLSPGMSKDVLFSEWEAEDFLREPYLLLLIALGLETEEEPYGFISTDIWNFDTECIEDHGDYTRIAMRMDELSGGCLSLEDIEDYVNIDEGQAWLAFKSNDKDYKWLLEVDNDWVDTNIFSYFDSLLRSIQADKRFTYLNLEGQDCLIGCSTPEQLEMLKATTGLKFQWLSN